MGTNKTLSVFLKLNSKAFTSGLKSIEGKLNKFSKKIGAVGSSLTQNVSMPLIGLGAVAIKTASEFESSMTKIQTLVGLPKDAVDDLGDAVLNLSGEVARSPKELADGLYFLTSAGLDAESAMKALESVAKGSTAGLGDMESLSVVAAAAQNAYGEEVLSSSKALDIFGSMVQSGMFKSEELANVLGSQLGLAANLGISMEEVGAMISTYTRTTGSATDATTGLSGIMMSFAKITPKAGDALAKATEGMVKGGMSADDLRGFLGENGLQKTLLMLQEQFSSAGIPLSEFFSKSQALKGVLGIVGTQSENYVDILNNMGEAQGFVNDAFDTTSDTSAFKFQQALASLQAAGVQLGEALMPIATKIATVFTNMANKFSSMSEESREKIVKLGLAMVALGPTLIIISKLVAAFSMVVNVIRTARVAMVAFGRSMMMLSAIGVIIGGIVIAIGFIAKNWDIVKEKLVDVINFVITAYNEFQLARIAIEAIGFAFQAVWEFFKLGINNIVSLFQGLGNIIEDVINFRSPKESFDQMVDDMKGNVSEFASNTAEKWDNMMNNIQTRKQVELIDEEDLDATLNNIKGKVSGAVDGIKDSVSGLMDGLLAPTDDGGGGEGEDGLQLNGEVVIDGIVPGEDVELDDDGNPLFKITGNLDTDEMTNKIMELEQATQSAFDGMANATDGGAEAMGESILRNTRDVIKAKTAEATASLAASIFASVPPPLNAILAAGAGAVVGTLFNQMIPPFADGGLVSGATLAMVGEGAGTSMVNPEVIAPLDKLKGMIGGGGGKLHGSISGSDILLSNDRSSITKDRVSGSQTNF
jgi:TP901 family phage tail tape measure protein